MLQCGVWTAGSVVLLVRTVEEESHGKDLEFKPFRP